MNYEKIKLDGLATADVKIECDRPAVLVTVQNPTVILLLLPDE